MHAYKQAAADALANNTWIEKEVTSSLHLTFAYEQLNQAMSILKAMHIIIREQQFESTCHLTITVSRSILPQLIAKLEIIPNILVEEPE